MIALMTTLNHHEKGQRELLHHLPNPSLELHLIACLLHVVKKMCLLVQLLQSPATGMFQPLFVDCALGQRYSTDAQILGTDKLYHTCAVHIPLLGDIQMNQYNNRTRGMSYSVGVNPPYLSHSCNVTRAMARARTRANVIDMQLLQCH